MFSTIAESLNIAMRFNPDVKEEIKRELQMLNEIENQNLLEDSKHGE